MMHWGDHGWGLGFGWFRMALFWIAVIGVVAYAVRAASSRNETGSPLGVLRRRYAKGEITNDEYDRMKNDIAGS